MTQRKVYLSRRRVNRRGDCASVFITKPENVVFPAGMTLQKNTGLKIKPKGQHDSTNQGGLFQATVRQKSPRENTSKREKLVSSNTRKAIGGTPKKKKRFPIAQKGRHLQAAVRHCVKLNPDAASQEEREALPPPCQRGKTPACFCSGCPHGSNIHAALRPPLLFTGWQWLPVYGSQLNSGCSC